MSKIERFVIGKGLTRKVEGQEYEFTRKYLRLEVRLPEQFTEEGFKDAVTRAEYIIDNFLGQPEAAKIPDFNAEELMKHEWKGKKTGEGQYAKGSLSWGWDFKDKFSPDVIKALEKGPVQIDQYEFTLEATGNIVSTKKKKSSAR